jgi:hypothetical protein
MKEHVQVTYLCPLDWASCLPQVSFDNVAIRNFNSVELDALLNPQEQQHHPWFKPAEPSQLSQFSWLVVGKNRAQPKRFDERYMSGLSGIPTVMHRERCIPIVTIIQKPLTVPFLC